MTHAHEEPTEAVRRWELSGGHWRVLAQSDTSVVVGLFSCDGEEMHRVTASREDLDTVLAGRTTDDD